ncbi:MAG TPA: LpxL/LpxP family Kdo(2)-lipid IV(A) lauroyl/palmitoleoyl acyltransferase [Gammaproteobacteria bacterium]|nr:LpxL/LpxP family Kdo(2)-lipid IV(A) lauroyl/palmitoleoyl acyltransferase [Gammaproteobacteria bacterium]
MRRMSAAFLKPRYWPLWLALGAIRLATLLPYRAQRPLGFAAGSVIRLFAGRRRRITRINLERCFPELTPAARRRLEKQHFQSLGMGLIELGMCWWASPERLRRLVRIEGLEHLQAATAKGRGAMLLTAHFTTLEIGGAMLTLFVRLHAMYRPNRNPLLDAVIRRGRERRAEHAIPRDDVRAMLKSLKAGVPIWYAPDQGYRGRNSVVAPFFGVPAPTNPATGRIARVSGAPVTPFFVRRLANGDGYLIRLLPALTDFPSGDDAADAARVNAVLEAGIRDCPEQYLWSHDRFKIVPRKHRRGNQA